LNFSHEIHIDKYIIYIDTILRPIYWQYKKIMIRSSDFIVDNVW